MVVRGSASAGNPPYDHAMCLNRNPNARCNARQVCRQARDGALRRYWRLLNVQFKLGGGYQA